MKNLLKEIRFCYNDILYMLLVPLGGWVLGEVIVLNVIYFADIGEYFSVGSAIAFGAVVIFTFIFPLVQIIMNFDIAVSMGRARKHYLAGISIVLFVEIFAMFLVATLLSLFTSFIKNTFFAAFPFVDFFGVISLEIVRSYWWVALAVPTLLVIFGFLLSALVKRFTAKVLWVFWAIYMVAVFTGTSGVANFDSLSRRPELATFVQALVAVPPVAYVALAVTLVAGILFFSVRYLLKASV